MAIAKNNLLLHKDDPLLKLNCDLIDAWNIDVRPHLIKTGEQAMVAEVAKAILESPHTEVVKRYRTLL